MTCVMTKNSLYQRDIISTRDLQLVDVDTILAMAKVLKERRKDFAYLRGLLQNKIIANCFFEPSTRTRLSFETAALRAGAQLIGFASDESTSVQKGETLHDTMQVISEYADLIVMRHPGEGAAALAAQAVHCPVVNAGDGANQHPTQALLDLFTMQECQPSMNGLSIALVGDLKYGRTIHSLTNLLSLYDVRLYLVAPEDLSLPDLSCDHLKRRGVRFSFHQNLDEVIPKVDILYLTRIQQERFCKDKYVTQSPFIVNAKSLTHARANMKILHPLPRVNEIATDVDATPYAYYFQQAANGVYVRQALLTLILNESI